MNKPAKIETGHPLSPLRQPFPAHQISKLPKPYKRDSAKGKCAECGGYHGLPAVHLDYVGHAALTDRLLDTDMEWSWEPAGLTPEGLPALDRNGGLWIKLTVCGVTRYGYGAADGKSGGDAMKEMIGDALRNAAMRFGAALDLWHKGDLHLETHDPETGEISTGEQPKRERVKLEGTYTSPSALRGAIKTLVHNLNGFSDLGEMIAYMETQDAIDAVEQCQRDMPDWWTGDNMPAEFKPLSLLIADKKRELEEIETINNRRTPVDAG